ncbi:proteasome endopeptidase complex, archaeal, beta subunit [Methanosarcinales archaeon]|uniref:Proteasome subunit beta n=1 Tax=Candidatus Syntropharchaeum caldarium TaxID=1838285 RepID=A0A1F2PBS9_9EURY|nr:MAG: Peptidase T1A, proteasome beta-subunit, archaeal [Candidatus Syntrophoarchaeum caldarius]RLG35424.1 MAG: proteasome endopeptidase complex, archaeal, beta subunit [Methanosarcinales archaeon]
MDDIDVKKGTTTVGVVCKDGVVLGSEKRATMGNFIASKTADKIYQIDDFAAMTTAGLVGDAQALVRFIKVETSLYKMRRSEPMTIKSIVTLMSNILNGNRFFPYYVQLLVGGIDYDGPHIYSLDAMGGLSLEKEAVATGSGSPIAYGILEDRYRKEMEIDEGIELAVRALHTAMKRDSASGEGIDVVAIQKNNYSIVEPSKIETIRNTLP